MNPNEPLGLPKGSVRSLLAIFIVGIFGVLAIRSNVSVDPKDFGSVVLLIVGAYFVSRSAKGDA